MLTFFTTAKPFQGHNALIQRNALQSWKRLYPEAEIILFGKDEGVAEVCAELGLRHEPEIIVNPSGTKRLDSIFGRAQEIASKNLLCYANCDIVLTKDFRVALEQLLEWRRQFLMVGRRWDTDIVAPIDFSSQAWEQEIVDLAHREGCHRFYHNIDYFLFPRGLYGEIPPLVIGRIGWDPWLIGKAHASGTAVVDVSDRVCAVHQNHDYGYHPQGMTGVWNDEEARRNLELAQGIRSMTIEDAAYRLTGEGLVRNRWCWLAPAKRAYRDVVRSVRGWVRTRLWHPLLDRSRSARHSLGLSRDAVPKALRSRQRRHWMDR